MQDKKENPTIEVEAVKSSNPADAVTRLSSYVKKANEQKNKNQ